VSRKQATQIGARRQQYQAGEQHQSPNECGRRTGERSKALVCQGGILMSEFFWVSFFQIRPDSVHVGGGLGGGDARL